ncbi:TPA: hypothetical protein RNX65_001410 [Pasteurella multocida]|nr:hypothetical protein [Pasteurella multocida]
MKAELFALHNTPINRTALYAVYSSEYKKNRTIERCEEYDNVILALQDVDAKLSALKDSISKKSISVFEYKRKRENLIKRKEKLMSLKEKIKEEKKIIGRIKGDVSFNSILIDELYQMLDKAKFDAALRNAKVKYMSLIDIQSVE